MLQWPAFRRAVHRLGYMTFCVGLAVLVFVGLERYLIASFVAQTSHETATALGLVDAFVTTYSANYSALESSGAPVPATFRAHALARFDANRREAGSRLRVAMVGMPGKEIATPPSDGTLIAALRSLERSGNTAATSTLTRVDERRLLRTVLPSLANHESCVECHNRLQPDLHWARGQMMGALVVDAPADEPLARVRLDAVMAAVATFFALMAVGYGARRVVVRAQSLRDRIEREAQGRLAGAIETLASGVAVFDRHDRLVLCNPAYRQMHGIVADRVRPGETFAALLECAVRSGRYDLQGVAAEDFIAERLSRHRAAELPFERRLADGRWEQVREQPLADGGRSIVLIDVTREKAREAELQRAVQEATTAVQQQRRFVSIVAHEFRTPLTIIDGAAQRLIRGSAVMRPEELRARAGKVRAGVARMANLIDTLLDSARLDAGHIQIVKADIDILVPLRSLIRRFETLAEGFEIVMTATAPSVVLAVDPRIFDQIATNLLSNAVKYSDASRRIEIHIDAGEDVVAIRVRDYGIGIPATELSQIFTRFYRASTARGLPGTGIGLNLVRELVELHEGHVAVESSPGQGSTFSVILPRVGLVPTRVPAEPRVGTG